MPESPPRIDVDRPLNVLYSFPHAIGAPGIGWTAWNQVTELIALGHQVHVVAGRVVLPLAGAASVSTTLQVGRFRVPHRVVGRDRIFRWHDRVAARRVRNLKPDVVHGWPLAFVKTAAVASALKIPILREAPNTHTANAYEVVTAEYERLGLEVPIRATHTFNARHLDTESREWAVATAILVPSDAVRDTFLHRGFEPARLIRHQYGYRPSDAPLAASTPRPFTAVFLGRGEPRKGLHYALQAWLASTAAAHGRFLIYGDILPEYREHLDLLLNEPSVEMRGFTSDPQSVLATADVMVLPTIEEGSALTTYEAQGVGCVPLVSTAAGAMLKHGVSGLLHEPRSIATLARQLSAVASTPEYLAQLREGALAHRDELTWAAAGKRLVNAYAAASRLVSKESHVNTA